MQLQVVLEVMAYFRYDSVGVFFLLLLKLALIIMNPLKYVTINYYDFGFQ